MSVWQALILGAVQGITEFLPVSSSGHLSLFQHFTGTSGEAGVFFSLMLHLGTLIAVFIAFRKTIWQLILEFFSIFGEIFTGKFSWKNRTPYRHMLFMFVIACLPMIFVLVFKDFYTAFSADDNIFWEGVFFLVTAAMLWFVETGQMPAWMLLIVICREFAVSGLRMIASDKGRVIAAGWSGKVKTASTMVCVVLMFLPIPPVVNTLCVWVITLTTLYSGVEYFVKNKDIIASA